jgi:hypothetical protein
MKISKISYGIIAITTIVLMFATTVGSAINQADAQREDRRPAQEGRVNNEANQAQGVTQLGGLANINVGNVAVGVGVPANVCVICDQR